MKIINAYQTEQRVLPAVIDMESQGVRIRDDIHEVLRTWEKKFNTGERYLAKICPDHEPGKKKFFEYLRENGFIDENKIEYTAKKNPRYGKEFLPKMISDKKLCNVLVKRSEMKKILTTYLRPWAKSHIENEKYFYPYFNQVRGEDDYGTRTGRFSSNLQQIPKINESLLNVRQFIVPDKNQVMIQRDYSGQELRIAAHYAEGNILQRFQADPDFDAHGYAQDEMYRLFKKRIDRPKIKGIGFLKIYGGGPKALAEKFGLTYDQALRFFKMYDAVFPELKVLAEELEQQLREGILLRTWGGRLYDVEQSKIIKGKHRHFYYKLINILIQGSAADMTKHAIANYYESEERKGRLMFTVHDELVCSVSKRYAKKEMALLKECMENLPGWDVVIKSDGKIGESFGQLKEYTD